MIVDKLTGEVLQLRTPYNYDTDEVSVQTGLACQKPSKTQRQFKEETDINTIVERFGKSGEKPPTGTFPTEQDFTEAFDFQTSMNVLVKARETFMELPAKTRARFQNDPQQFMQFIHDEENTAEAAKLGLIKLRVEHPAPAPEQKKEEKKE